MGLHFYDESPSWPSEQRGRLGPPLAIFRAGIPCVVWAEDALSIVHRVPTNLFDQQLLVPDDKVPESVNAICASLPYRVIVGGDDEESRWRDMRAYDPDRPHAFKLGPTDTVVLSHAEPDVAYEQEAPQRILVHRASTFHFDMNDSSKTMLNPDPPDPDFAPLRFPTVSAFLDSTVDIFFEPPVPMKHFSYGLHLMVCIGYTGLYTLSYKGDLWVADPETDERVLVPRVLEALDAVKEENRPLLIRKFVGRPRGSYMACASERQALKAARFERLGMRYEPPASIPYDALARRQGLKESERDGFGEPKQTPYLIRNNHNALSVQWRALARYTSLAGRLLR
ncbi:hypothetical protein B0H15DRAFT_183946 [Mycena belliarum]|uniref:Uncharacterized protein n=1 Tax=Mycena belliarum TaxID=1033014 RepID=A0AAD6XQH2_9AGAR|nr:hypothetical protein B0H15DRAFT_183946 [Mycena belliae]